MPSREESIALFPPPRPEAPPWPGLSEVDQDRPEDLTDIEWHDVLMGRVRRSEEEWFLSYEAAYQELAESAWDALRPDQKLDWAAGHRILYVDIDGERWDVRKRQKSPVSR